MWYNNLYTKKKKRLSFRLTLDRSSCVLNSRSTKIFLYMHKMLYCFELDKQILIHSIEIRIMRKSRGHTPAGVRSEKRCAWFEHEHTHSRTTCTREPSKDLLSKWERSYFPPVKTSIRNKHVVFSNSNSTQSAFFLIYFRLKITLSEKSRKQVSSHSSHSSPTFTCAELISSFLCRVRARVCTGADDYTSHASALMWIVKQTLAPSWPICLNWKASCQ